MIPRLQFDFVWAASDLEDTHRETIDSYTGVEGVALSKAFGWRNQGGTIEASASMDGQPIRVTFVFQEKSADVFGVTVGERAEVSALVMALSGRDAGYDRVAKAVFQKLANEMGWQLEHDAVELTAPIAYGVFDAAVGFPDDSTKIVLLHVCRHIAAAAIIGRHSVMPT